MLRHLVSVAALALPLLAASAVQASEISDKVEAAAQDSAMSFGDVYQQGGISGAAEAIEACYGAFRRKATIEKLAGCAALDIVAANTDNQAIRSLGVPGYPFFSGTKPDKRIAAGMKLLGLTRQERDAFNRAIMVALNGGEAIAPSPASATGASSVVPSVPVERIDLQSLDGMPYLHNGSLMVVDPAKGLIVYEKPKKSLAGTIKPGTVLFRGKPWDPDSPDSALINGRAFVFRKGCEAAAYTVRGMYHTTYQGAQFTLQGSPPVRAKGSCDITGAKLGGANAELQFDIAWD